MINNKLTQNRLYTSKKNRDANRRRPRLLLWLFYLYIISLPFFGFSFFNLGERGFLRPDWIIGGLMICVFTLNLGIDRIRLKSSPTNKFVLFFVFTGLFGLVNLFNASNTQFIDFGTKLAQLLLVTGIFFVISSMSLKDRELKIILKLWVLVALITAIYAIYQLFARSYGWPVAYLEITNPTVGGTRGMKTGRAIAGYVQISGFLREPSYLAAYLLPPFVLCLTLLLKGQARGLLLKNHFQNWTILIILLGAILLSGSLGGFLTLPVIIFMMFTSNKISHHKFIKLIIVFVPIFLLVVSVLSLFGIGFIEGSVHRIEYLFLNIIDPTGTPQITSFKVRQERALAALDVWLLHPLLGVGLNNFPYYTENITKINSGWVEVLVHQGIMGLMALILTLWTLLRSLNKLSIRLEILSPFWSALAIGIGFVLVTDIVNSFPTLNWTHPMRWFTLSLANLIYIHTTQRTQLTFHEFGESSG